MAPAPLRNPPTRPLTVSVRRRHGRSKEKAEQQQQPVTSGVRSLFRRKRALTPLSPPDNNSALAVRRREVPAVWRIAPPARIRPTAEPLVAGAVGWIYRAWPGRWGQAGTPLTHPWGLGRGIHAADTPPDPTAPAPDSFRAPRPRKIKRKEQKRVASLRVERGSAASGVRSLFLRKRDLTPLSPPDNNSALAVRRRENERVGPGWGRGTAGAMDGAYEPPWMG